MNKLFLLVAVSLVIFIFSCNGPAENNIVPQEIDSSLFDTLQFDELSGLDTISIDSAGYADEELVLTKEIEKKYGKQWDFCDCVVKNDSVNTALMTTDDDSQMDLIIARMEVIDSHCVEILTFPNTTPDERAKHERKVNKCLKAAKK
jgi:hypothetical protein